MKIKNKDLRESIKNSGMKYWEVAECLNITCGMFSIMLRKELEIDQKNNIMKIISEFKKG